MRKTRAMCIWGEGIRITLEPGQPKRNSVLYVTYKQLSVSVTLKFLKVTKHTYEYIIIIIIMIIMCTNKIYWAIFGKKTV